MCVCKLLLCVPGYGIGSEILKRLSEVSFTPFLTIKLLSLTMWITIEHYRAIEDIVLQNIIEHYSVIELYRRLSGFIKVYRALYFQGKNIILILRNHREFELFPRYSFLLCVFPGGFEESKQNEFFLISLCVFYSSRRR